MDLANELFYRKGYGAESYPHNAGHQQREKRSKKEIY
jgi:hypothetical protein